MNMAQSKTVVGLVILLLCVLGLSFFGKLTPEAVDAIKWIGGTYMAVRTAANIAENVGSKS